MTKTAIPETLEEFALKLDAILGRQTSIDDAVRGYCLARDVQAAFKPTTEWRVGLDAGVKHMFTQGIGPDQRHKIIQVNSGGGTRLAVRAGRVKERYPKLYEAARVPTSVVNANGPTTKLTLPTYKGARVFSALEWMANKRAEARKLNDTSREIILACATEMEWQSGDSWVTSDGWQIGRTVSLRFSEPRLRQLLEENGKDAEALDLVEEVAVPLKTYYRLSAVDPATDMDELSV